VAMSRSSGHSPASGTSRRAAIAAAYLGEAAC
jgi:hypothetical protein